MNKDWPAFFRRRREEYIRQLSSELALLDDSVATRPAKPVSGKIGTCRKVLLDLTKLSLSPNVPTGDERYMYEAAPRIRRLKAISGGSFLPRDPGFDRKIAMTNVGHQRPLFDRIAFGVASRKFGNVDGGLTSRRVCESRSHTFHDRNGTNQEPIKESKPSPLQAQRQLVAQWTIGAKRINVDEGQSAAASKSSLEQWQAQVALHKTPLREHSNFVLASQHPSASNQTHSIGRRLLKKISKVKRGLASFVNGARLSVIADTGAAHNVITAAYVKERNMKVDTASTSFKLGNSSVINSIGTVTIDYAFAEEPSKVFKLVCHVLPHCIYDLILGNAFLTATETMSKYRRRLTECMFSVANVFHLGYLGNYMQTLKGTLADQYAALAVPDTGAERNVMDLQ
jgi:hypothetical protein